MSNPFFASNPQASLSSSRELTKITESWTKDLTQLTSTLQTFEKISNEAISDLYKNETHLIQSLTTLELITNHHNTLDNILQRLIDKQNNITEDLDTIQSKLLETISYEESLQTETRESLYEKSKRLEQNKHQIDTMTEAVLQKFSKAPTQKFKSASDQLDYCTFLHSNTVTPTQVLLSTKFESIKNPNLSNT